MGLIDQIKTHPTTGDVNHNRINIQQIMFNNAQIWKKYVKSVKAVGYVNYYDNGPGTSSHDVVNYENGIRKNIHYKQLVDYMANISGNIGYLDIDYPSEDYNYYLTALVDNLYYQTYQTTDLNQLIHLPKGSQIIYPWNASLRTYYFYKYE